MRRRTSIVALGAVLLGGALAATAGAESPPGEALSPASGPHRMVGRFHDRLGERLGLTDAQREAFQAAWARQRESRRQLEMDLRQAQIALRQLALNGGDAAAIEAASAEVQKVLGQMLQLRVQVLQEIGPVLTPEQKEKLARLGYPGGWHRGHRAPRAS